MGCISKEGVHIPYNARMNKRGRILIIECGESGVHQFVGTYVLYIP